MLPHKVFTEEVLINAGVDADAAWDLVRTLSETPDLGVPDGLAPTVDSLANLYELTGHDPKRIEAFLVCIGENAVGAQQKVDADPQLSAVILDVIKSNLTAMFFDVEMVKSAYDEVSVSGGTVETTKRSRYKRYGIKRELVFPDMLPSSRETLARYLTNMAFIDGFPEDHDQLPIMELIREDPLTVLEYVKSNLFGEGLRLFCVIRDNDLLRNPNERPDRFDFLTEQDVIQIRSDAEYFMLNEIRSLLQAESLSEAERAQRAKDALDRFIEDCIAEVE